jgi:hypothetical protein
MSGSVDTAFILMPSLSKEEKSNTSTANVNMKLNINDHMYEPSVAPRATVCDISMKCIHVTGTKNGCDRGQLAACAVMINIRRVGSCLALTVLHHGDRVATIKCIDLAGKLHLMQRALYEAARQQIRTLYAATNRMTAHRVTPLDLVPPSSMRAPSTATGQPIFEIAMDETTEKPAVDGTAFGIRRSGGIMNSIRDCLRSYPFMLDKLAYALPEQT